MKTRDWRRARIHVRTHEVTDRMLAPVQRAADSSWIPQTVYPSRWFGQDYVGHDALLISTCAMSAKRPADAVKDSEPLMTVLPARYLRAQMDAKQDHENGWCNAGMCTFCHPDAY